MGLLDIPSEIMSGIGGAIKSANVPDPTTGLSFRDKLALAGGQLRDAGSPPGTPGGYAQSALEGIQAQRQLPYQRAQQLMQMQMMQGMLSQFSQANQQGQQGQPGAQPQQAAPPPPMQTIPSTGTGMAPLSIPQMGAVPQPSAPQASQGAQPGMVGIPPALRNYLAMSAAFSGKPADAASILAGDVHVDRFGNRVDGKTGQIVGPPVPTPRYENGQLVNPNDPSAPKFVGAPPAPGAEPLYDSQGNRAGWRMANGSVQALNSAANAAVTDEDKRKNLVAESIARTNAVSSRIGAGASATSANTGAANSGNVAPPPGFIIRSPR